MESEETDHVENNGVADPQEPTDGEYYYFSLT